MEELSQPCSYRFFKEQKAWIQRRAKEQGHRSEVVYLRRLIQEDMKREARREKVRA
jgi:hypothetical protein